MMHQARALLPLLCRGNESARDPACRQIARNRRPENEARVLRPVRLGR
jgi:hypothetical protein